MLVCSPAKNNRPHGRASHARSDGSYRRSEIRVAAARQRFLLPHDLTPRPELSPVRPEPLERTRQSLRPFFRHDPLCGVAGAAAGEQREDARRAALFLVAVPHRAERERRSEGARPPRYPPEALRELQQRFCRAAVFQVGDRVVLLRGQRGHERNAPERGGRQGEHGVVAADLRHGAAVLHADPDVLAAVRHGDDFRVQVEAIAQRRRQRGGEAIVAAVDAVHRLERGSVVRGELIDERDE